MSFIYIDRSNNWLINSLCIDKLNNLIADVIDLNLLIEQSIVEVMINDVLKMHVKL